MERIREIVFYIFVVAYIILCPLLILYTFGYIPNTSKEKLVQTGVIYLSSNPSEAQIFLEKSRYTDKTPAAIKNLLPGYYTVKVLLKNYNPWSHTVLVEPGKAVPFENILLVPKNWNPKKLSDESFSVLTPLAGNDFFLLSKDTRLKDYYVYDYKKNTARSLLGPSGKDLFNVNISEVFSVEKSPAVIMEESSLFKRRFIYLTIGQENTDIKDISKFIADRPTQISWNYLDYNAIFILRKDSIDRLDTELLDFYPKYLEGVRGLGFYNNRIYIINNSNNILVSRYDKKDFKALVNDSNIGGLFSMQKDSFKIMPCTGSLIMFLGAKGELLSSHPPYFFVDKDVSGVIYEPDEKMLLVWTKNAIGVIEYFKEEKAERPTPRILKIHWVFEKGSQIEQCFWAYGGSHIIFRDANKVFLAELVPQGEAHVDFIGPVKKNSSVFYSEEKGSLYYLGFSDGKLYEIKLIPNQELVFTHFNEERNSNQKKDPE